jgi:hypothetical protein
MVVPAVDLVLPDQEENEGIEHTAGTNIRIK